MIIVKWVIVYISIIILIGFMFLETIGIKAKFKDTGIEAGVYIALGIRMFAQFVMILAVLIN